MAADRQDNKELFDHLVGEFGELGREAVQFLETAQQLLDDPAALRLPRQAGAAAYCVREALKRLLPAESRQASWRKLSDDVVNAKKRFEAARGLPGADQTGALDDLITAIRGLEDFKRNEQGKHQRRLTELIERRAGVPPLTLSIREYQRLLGEIDQEAVHSSPSEEQVRQLFGRAISVLNAVFAPFPVRRAELDALAPLTDPQEPDVSRLLAFCSTSHHLTYFLSRAVTPRWLTLLAPHGVLDPPEGGGVWPVLPAVEHFAGAFPEEVATWLEQANKAWGRNEVGAAYIALAARQCLPAASNTLLSTLRSHPGSRWIRGQAAVAIEEMEPGSPFIEAAADVLLTSEDEISLVGVGKQTIKALVDGMTAENADTRIALLAAKVSAGAGAQYLAFSLSHLGLAEQPMEEERRGGVLLIRGLAAAVRRAVHLGCPTGKLLALIGQLPPALKHRFRSIVLAEATDLPDDALVSDIADAIRHRNPTAEDVLVIDRITRDVPTERYVAEWRTAIGHPPAPEVVGRMLASHDIPREWQRARLWRRLLPDSVGDAWRSTATLISPVDAPTRADLLTPRSDLEFEYGRSPMTKPELDGLDIKEAGRRISSWRPDGDHMTIARELGRTVEDVVASDARRWSDQPLEVLGLLRHATYVHHYFEGLAKAAKDLSGLGPQIIEAVVFARTHPWDTERLGNDDFDYDPTWAPADEAGVNLIGSLAQQDVDLGSQYEDAWRVVLAAARDRSRKSGLSPREDPLDTAINRPCTRALEAVFHLIATEFRRGRSVRQDAIELFDEALDLEGWSGAEHRAIIAPRLQFLLHVAPDWVESRDSKLFGDKAAGELGQKTVELALKWGRPNRWLLERQRRPVFRAIRNGSDPALEQALVAMLWGVPGYSIVQTLHSLSPMGQPIVSKSGASLARLLIPDEASIYAKVGLQFWESALADSSLTTEAFRGFGWWAQVEALDREVWEQMMLRTCQRAIGRLDLCVEVAERSVREPMTATGLEILVCLLRGRNEPWERSLMAEIGLRALKAAADATMPGECQRLRAALTDLGHFQAADI
ncbi:MAG: hypothetical protein M3256_00385 [Actinomycetota bacterium]|nr:hypothetical protein [Actinomycetota bacterium]